MWVVNTAKRSMGVAQSAKANQAVSRTFGLVSKVQAHSLDGLVGPRRGAVLELVGDYAWPIAIWFAMLGWASLILVSVRTAYNEFRYGRFDLGNMVQAVWSTAHGRPLEITMGATGEQMLRLGGHVDPVLALLAPAWLIAPSPLTIAAVQIVACALGALPVFWLGRRHLESETSAGILTLAYLAYPWLAWAALDAMHPVTLAIPLLLFALWFLDGDRLWAFGAVAGLACLTGELVGVTVAGLGLWYALARGKRSGFVIALAGSTWTAVCVYFIVPTVSGGHSMFYGLFTEVGGSPQGVLKTLVTDPATIAGALHSHGYPVMLLFLILPIAGLCVLSPGLATVALPQLLVNGLSSQFSATDPRIHHVSLCIPFLFGALVLGIARLPMRLRVGASVVALAASLGASLLMSPWTYRADSHSPYSWRHPSVRHLTALRAAIALVPDGAAVSATNRAGGHLSARRRMYSVPIVGSADWVVIDTRDPWVPFPSPGSSRTTWGTFDPMRVDRLVMTLAGSPQWRTVLRNTDGVYVFKRVVVPSRATSG